MKFLVDENIPKASSSIQDFFHTIPFQYQSHHGIIVIALYQPNRTNITQKLKWVLDNQQLDCVVYKPNQDSLFDWEYYPAYKEFDVV